MAQAKTRKKGTGPLIRQTALLARMKASLPSLRRTDKVIAEAILRDPERIVTSPIAELSRISGASEGSIVGFCQRLNMKGYSEFKIALARDLAGSGLSAGTALSKTSHLGEIISYHINCLSEVPHVNDEKSFKAAVNSLRRARRIGIFSIGMSFAPAFSAAAKFRLIGLPAVAHADAHLQLIDACNLGRGDAALGISSSGTTNETISCLQVAQEKGAKTICITNAMSSPITSVSDICLYATPSEVNYFQAPLASRVTQLAIIDALFVALTLQDRDGAGAMLQRSAEELRRFS
jgi:DNA-binding MurR/RpiR family transcriptional regulator